MRTTEAQKRKRHIQNPLGLGSRAETGSPIFIPPIPLVQHVGKQATQRVLDNKVIVHSFSTLPEACMACANPGSVPQSATDPGPALKKLWGDRWVHREWQHRRMGFTMGGIGSH